MLLKNEGKMRKIFVFIMASLDGFFEGPDHELDWHNVDAEFNEFAAGQLNEIDTLLFGWKTYDLMAGYWPSEPGKQESPVIADKMNEMQKITFSRKERKVEWENTRLVKDNVGWEIMKLKNQPGKDIAIFGSSNLCVSLIQMGLIDEFRIMMNPVVLGRGHTLFNGLHDKLNLKLLKTRNFNSGNVLLYYQSAKK
jgi:dihydrofolate reductase